MATNITIYYSDGSESTFKYRLPRVARYIKSKKGISKFSELRAYPVLPWLIRMVFEDLDSRANGKEVVNIEIKERVI